MDIRHLLYFLEVAKHRSFTRASEELHITQPTISKMVKNLEEELGVTLLDRQGKQVALTDAGEVVVGQAQQIVRSFDHLAAELADVMQIRRGRIRMGIPPMIGANFFPKVLAAFYKLYPDVTIQLKEEGAKQIEQLIIDGELDLGVAVLPVEEERFHSFSFVNENLMLIVHPSHKLAGRERVLLSELRDEPFLLFREGFALHDHILAESARAGFRPKVAYESSQWDFMSEMVAANLGVALLPARICRTLDQARVSIIPNVEPAIPWHLAVIWPRDRYVSFATREWIRFAKEAMHGE
ncbi:MAG: LysR family transcriptional regulator [Tumebacillaceae bacterium]